MLQKLVNIMYRYPRATIKKYQRFGGYFNYRKMIRAAECMKLAAFRLPPVQSCNDGLKIYFFTGKNYLYQTLFCISSLVKISTEKYCFILVDDGTFDNDLIALIEAHLPGAQVFTEAMISKNLQQRLPGHLYPVLHQKRKVYQHIKKLTDIHTLPGDPWKLVLDSDMLFWKTPAELLKWLKLPDRPLHMVDSDESYGYSIKLMEKLSGGSIRPLVNVGMIGLNSAQLDWNEMEKWVRELEENEGKTYYLEQALTAMLIGDAASVILDPQEYIVNPGQHANGTLHHYVDLSKEIYFRKKWKLIR